MNDSGAASVEYVMVLALVTIGVCLALLVVGSSMVQVASLRHSVLLLPVP